MNDEFIRKKPREVNNASALYGMSHKVIALSIAVFGLIIASTVFAVDNPGFVSQESPLFYWGKTPIYAPWMIFVWLARAYSFENIRDDFYSLFKKSANIITLTTVVMIAVYFILSYIRGVHHRFDHLYGTSRWATKVDLRKNGLLSSSGIICGQLFNANIAYDGTSGSVKLYTRSGLFGQSIGRLIAHIGLVHTMMVAPSRSGKGFNSVITTLLSWAGSAVIIDPKGENYNITAGYRKSFSYVCKFSPTSVDSIHINPMQEIRCDDLYAFDDASNLAQTLLAPSGESPKPGSTEAYFQESAMAFLTGVILHILTCDYYTQKTLGQVTDFISQVKLSCEGESDYGSGFAKEMIEYDHIGFPMTNNAIKNAAGKFLEKGERERGSLIGTVDAKLWIFNSPLIRQNTSDNELSSSDFLNSNYPISLYITIPYSDFDRLSTLIRIFISFFVRRFTSGEAGYDVKRLSFKTLFLLDEFASLGSFSFMEKTMGIIAGFGITFFLIVQSLNQLINLYGEKNPFMEHCRVWITFAPGDYHSAELFSKIIGQETVWKEQVSTSGSKLDIGMKQMSIQGNEVARNLINPDEIMKLEPNQLLVFAHGMPPYRGKKVVYYDDKRFMYNANLPCPTTRKDILGELPRGGNLSDLWIAKSGVISPSKLSKLASNGPDFEFVHVLPSSDDGVSSNIDYDNPNPDLIEPDLNNFSKDYIMDKVKLFSQPTIAPLLNKESISKLPENNSTSKVCDSIDFSSSPESIGIARSSEDEEQ